MPSLSNIEVQLGLGHPVIRINRQNDSKSLQKEPAGERGDELGETRGQAGGKLRLTVRSTRRYDFFEDDHRRADKLERWNGGIRIQLNSRIRNRCSSILPFPHSLRLLYYWGVKSLNFAKIFL